MEKLIIKTEAITLSDKTIDEEKKEKKTVKGPKKRKEKLLEEIKEAKSVSRK